MPQTNTIELTTAALRALGKLLNEAADRHAKAIVKGFTAATITPDLPADDGTMRGEPWTSDVIGDGLHVAFLDDRQSLRWVPFTQVPDAPAGWRPVLLGPEVKR